VSGARSLFLSIIVVFVVVVSFACGPLSKDGEEEVTRRSEGKALAEEIRFEWVSMGSGSKKDGTRISFGRLRSDDGVLVERRVESYRSSTYAQKEMQSRLIKAAKVLERGTKYTPDGILVGEKAILLLPTSKPGETRYGAVWTYGEKLFVVECSSLRHLLAFEKQDYPLPDPTLDKPGN